MAHMRYTFSFEAGEIVTDVTTQRPVRIAKMMIAASNTSDRGPTPKNEEYLCTDVNGTGRKVMKGVDLLRYGGASPLLATASAGNGASTCSAQFDAATIIALTATLDPTRWVVRSDGTAVTVVSVVRPSTSAMTITIGNTFSTGNAWGVEYLGGDPNFKYSANCPVGPSGVVPVLVS